MYLPRNDPLLVAWLVLKALEHQIFPAIHKNRQESHHRNNIMHPTIPSQALPRVRGSVSLAEGNEDFGVTVALQAKMAQSLQTAAEYDHKSDGKKIMTPKIISYQKRKITKTRIKQVRQRKMNEPGRE